MGIGKLFKEIRKAGDATIAYPAAPLDLPEGYRGKPEHNEAMCIACGACAIACPPNAITMSLDDKGENIVWDICYGRCIFCGRCHEVCPVFAIELKNEFELATIGKADLYESCAYPIKKCTQCGKPYASEKEVEYGKQILQAAGGAVASGVEACDLCEDCRRKNDALAAKRASKKGGDK